MPGEGGRSRHFGALVAGVYRDGELRYVGRVGSGFSQAELERVQKLLTPLERATSPFTGTQPPKETRFVEPQLVASVDYGELTRIGTLRHPRYKGPRDDLDPREIGPPEDG